MTTPALRQSWAEWRAFVEELDLSDGSPDVSLLHERLFRLGGKLAPRAADLQTALTTSFEALDGWITSTAQPPTELEQLRRAMTACEPGWRGLLGLTHKKTDWDEVTRAAGAAGLPSLDQQPFWTWHIQPTANRRFDLLSALRGRDHASSLALLDALLHIHEHPRGEPLFRWAREATAIHRYRTAIQTAALFRDAVVQGVLREELLAPLGWQELPGRLLALCQEVTLRFLSRLNEPVPGAAARPGKGAPAQTTKGSPARTAKGAPVREAPYRRAVPEPLPIEPSLRKITGCEGFLRAVAEEPLDLTHRLAFADWLEEKGHADRARFIRLQCEADRLPDHPLARRHLTEPSEALFQKHRAKWVGRLPAIQSFKPVDFSNFSGGLLEALNYDSWHFSPEDCTRMFALADIRILRTTSSGTSYAGMEPFLSLPFMPRVIALELNELYHEEDYSRLGGAEALAGLVHLRLGGNRLDASTARLFAQAFRLPALRSLDVYDSSLGSAGVQALVDGGVLTNLRRLRLSNSAAGYHGGLRTLASHPSVTRLEHLDLSGTYISSSVETLTLSPFLTKLTTLILDKGWLGDKKGAEILASAPSMKSLRCLSLRHSSLVNRSLQALAGSAHLAGLTVLDLSENDRISLDGVRALAESPQLTNLRALSLAGIILRTEGVQALANSPSLASLEVLDLAKCGLEAADARALLASPHLNKLAALNLSDGEIPPAVRTALRRRWPFARF